MATNIMGLFGATPEEIRARRMQQQQQEVANMANLTDPRAFMAYVGSGLGSQLAGAARDVGGMFGLRSQEEEQAMQEQEVLREAQQSGLSGSALYKRLADISADPRRAFVLRQQAAEMEREEKLQEMQMEKAEFDIGTIRGQRRLQDELAKLPENATAEDVLSISRRFGSPDQVISFAQKQIEAQAAARAKADNRFDQKENGTVSLPTAR